MPYPHTLPTTSPVSYPLFFTSPTHPPLPLLTSTHRAALRHSLKAHKRLPPASQPSNLPHLLTLLTTYTTHLLTLTSLLESSSAHLLPTAPTFTTSWRATLTPPSRLSPDREPPRVARNGLSYEIFFTLSTLAYSYTLLALSQLRSVLDPLPGTTPPSDPMQTFNQASSNLTTAASIYSHLLTRPQPPSASTWPIELTPPLLSALSSINLADATLVAVIKQDPYPTYISLTSSDKKEKKSRSGNREWLYSPPSPPTSVRALLLARICVAAADHAGRALGQLPVDAVASELRSYTDALQRVARAKACRFIGVDAEGGGRCGEAIGWIMLAREFLRTATSPSSHFSSSSSSGSKGVWGLDAGRGEEEAVCAALEKRWRKVNDSVLFQTVVGVEEVRGRMPSGREFCVVGVWEGPKLGVEELRALRGAGVEVGAVEVEDGEDSGGEVDGVKEEKGVDYAGKGGYY